MLRHKVAAAACALILLTSLPAAADVTLCNKMDRDYLDYAMLWDEGIPVFADIWIVQGWYRLEPGRCKTILKSSYRQTVYLSIRTSYRGTGDPRISHYDPAAINRDPYVTKGWHTIEAFFCVRDGSFRRTENEIEDHTRCPPGYYLQLFNQLGFAPVRTDLTLSLN